MHYTGIVLDQYDDPKNNNPLLKIASVMPQKSYDYALAMKTSHGMAYKFPINNAMQADLSAKYFVKTAQNLPEDVAIKTGIKIAEAKHRFNKQVTLNKTASEYNVDMTNDKGYPVFFDATAYKGTTVREKTQLMEKARLIKTAAKLSYQERSQLPDSAFALVKKGPKGGKIRKYPLIDKAHVHNAIQRFAAFRGDLSPSDRATIARNIKSAAKRFGITLSKDDPLHKYGSETINTASLKTEYLMRRQLLDEKGKKVLDTLMTKVASLSPEDMARGLEAIDKHYGLDTFYDTELKDPYEAVMTKEAQEETPFNHEAYTVDEALLPTVNKYLGEAFGEMIKNAQLSLSDIDEEALSILNKIKSGELD